MKLREFISLPLFALMIPLFVPGIIEDFFSILDQLLDLIIAVFEFAVDIIAYILAFFRAILNIFTGG